MKRIGKKLLALALCLAMLFSLLPAAFAQEGETENEPESEDGAIVLTKESEETDEEGSFLLTVADSGDDETDDQANPDALLQGYFDQLVRGKTDGRKGTTAGERLSGAEAQAYTALAARIARVASGDLASTKFKISAASLDLAQTSWNIAELGLENDPIVENNQLTEAAGAALNTAVDGVLSLSAINHALLADYPYELFWYDKTVGTSLSYGVTRDKTNGTLGINVNGDITFSYAVAGEYASGTYTANTTLIQSIQTAASNAQSVVTAYASNSDRAKLLGYANEICARVSYNSGAVNGGAAYGNPWQLIWVFDNDSGTNVVCEGYSKAFQYLCDLSAFQSGSVRCLSVSGVMSGGTGAGNHMWNIVRLDDGINYLVDVTNCDEGSIGYPDKLFLAVPTSGTVEDGYVFTANGSDIDYIYSADCLSTFSADDLTIGAAPRETVASGSCGSGLTWTLYDDGELVIEGSGAMRSGSPWSEYCESIVSVTLPEGLTSIGARAFMNCKSLTGVTLPDSLNTIDSKAFAGCTSLKNIVIWGNVSVIASDAFNNCSGLESFAVFDSNTYFSAYEGVLFNKEKTLLRCFPIKKGTDYVVPDSVVRIGSNAFASSDLTDITIPASVTMIGDNAFSGCSSLRRVTYGGTAAQWAGLEIGTNNEPLTQATVRFADTAVSASGNCGADGDNLTWVLYDNGELVISGSGEMADFEWEASPWNGSRSSILSLTIETGATSIGDWAFLKCENLTSVTIPNSVTSIGFDAFNGCSSLTGVSIPSGVTSIRDGAFSGCYALTEFVVSGDNTAYSSLGGVLFDKAQKTLLICPAGKSGVYSVPAGVTKIGNDAFDHCSLTSITVPDSVTSIDRYAFASSDSLTSVTIGAGVTSLGTGVFSYSPALAEIVVSADNTAYSSFGGVLFDKAKETVLRCPEGKSGVFGIPAGVTSIANTAFSNCKKLTGVSIPEGVTSIGSSAFSDCVSLTGVSIPSSVTSIEYAAFIYCFGLASVTIGPGVTSIVYYAFNSCSGLTDVYFRGTQAQREAAESGWSSEGNERLFDAAWHYIPVITSQPSDVSAELGSTATFRVTAEGDGLSYQWYYLKPGESTWNAVQNNGQNAVFNQTKVAQRHDGYKFKCVVTNPAGSVTSSEAVLTLVPKPIITAQPAGVTAALGSTATFRVTATGTDLSYQWYYQKPGESAWNIVLNNGQSAVFNQTKVAQRHDGYKFRCVVTNAYGSVTSSAATLSILPKPTITAQPADVSAALGSTATFRVTATNASSYQWYYQKPGESTWNAVQNNGQSAVFNQTKVASRHDGYKFKCVVTNASGSVTSSAATLSILPKPTITAQPSSVTAALGSTATFRVTATNASSYQWYYLKPGESTWNAVQNNGQSAVFNQTKVAARHDGYKFRCVVTNAAGSVTSSAATLTVQQKPTITAQPSSVTASLGSTATFRVTASGTGLSYQWYYQKPGESTWNIVQNNGQSAVFNQTKVAARHNGYKFKCVVTNASGSVTSGTATLTVG